jgi:hypothetical protein
MGLGNGEACSPIIFKFRTIPYVTQKEMGLVFPSSCNFLMQDTHSDGVLLRDIGYNVHSRTPFSFFPHLATAW